MFTRNRSRFYPDSPPPFNSFFALTVCAKKIKSSKENFSRQLFLAKKMLKRNKFVESTRQQHFEIKKIAPRLVVEKMFRLTLKMQKKS